MRKRHGRNLSGILVLDKPQGETSNRSLQRVKRLFQAAKAGHTGSLDPLATGVLPLCFGEATKISQFLLDSDKAYRTKIKLGVKTATGDSEGEIVAEKDCSNISLQQIEKALEGFRGEIQQIPSMYSALKHQGVPLYKLARAGKTVERKTRLVTIFELTLISYEGAYVELEIHCSKGTYVRTIADDLGEQLGVGAHVTALRRTQAGPFKLNQAQTHESLEKYLEQSKSDEDFSAIDEFLIPADQAVQELPEVILPSVTADFVLQGQAVIARHLPTSGLVRLYKESIFIGIGEILEDGRVAPKRLFLS
ncbi:MAG: tRNA pseudouridine(55) synthase TruB [Gammaproteobacteria bacterium]|jgi:tRNA pseudouridine55 synthase|nr:tRNA pseudouridine(55) synthase TruB [Gammaproteobacteria bacterium]